MKEIPFKIIKTSKIKADRFTIQNHRVETEQGEKEYSYLNINSGVTVLPIVGDRIGLIKQFRFPFLNYEYEFPAGMNDEGEEPCGAANRELLEETGLVAEKIIDLGYFYPSPGSTDEKIFLFAAICNKKTHNKLEILEKITLEYRTKEEIEEMIQQNEIRHGAGLVCWLKYILRVNKN